MNISLSLDQASIDKAIENLKGFIVDVQTGVEAGMQLTAEGAREVAHEAYGDKAYEEGPTKDKIIVSTQHDPAGKRRTRTTYFVSAKGKGVGMFEFGAGDMAGDGDPLAKNAPFEVYEGSYSKDNARQYVEKGYWLFKWNNVVWIYKFIHPRRGLYKATKYLRELKYRLDFLRGYKRD